MCDLETYKKYLESNELSEKTIISYIKDLKHFYSWLDNEDVTKDNVIKYKKHIETKFKTNSINLKIITLNKYFRWLNLDISIRQNKVQSKSYLDDMMSFSDYERVLRMAERLKKTKIKLIMKTLAKTGIRISELKYITVEAVLEGGTVVKNKGKERNITIPTKIAKELKKYCKENDIRSGIIFKGKSKNMIDASYVWREMKKISGKARVKKNKVHAHSFRHLFAKNFMDESGDILLLSDLLGHTSLETTRIYTKKTRKEQRKILDNVV